MIQSISSIPSSWKKLLGFDDERIKMCIRDRHDRDRLRPGRAGCYQCRVEGNLSGNQRLCAERIWLEGFKFIYFSDKTQMWN